MSREYSFTKGTPRTRARDCAVVEWEGTIDGIPWKLQRARKAVNKLALSFETKGRVAGPMKQRRHWLAETVGGQWTGRDGAYLLSPTMALAWVKLAEDGYCGGIRLRPGVIATVTHPNHPGKRWRYSRGQIREEVPY